MLGPTESVRQQLAVYSKVFEDLTDPIIVEDMSGHILDMNPEAERTYGWTREELLGRPVKILVPPQRHGQADELLRCCREGEIVRNVEGIRRTRMGDDRSVLLTLSLLTDESEQPIAIASVAKDISELKRAIGALRRSERKTKGTAIELERSNQKLREFARVCSHDLRAPLRAIEKFSQLLHKRYASRLDDTANEFIGYIADGAERMKELIEDLLEYARAETDELEMEETDCEEILEDTLANLEADIAECEAKVTHDPLPTVEADGTQLLQVFQNLISNAIKYRRGEPPKVHVTVQRDREHWRFSVRDNGIGIEPEKLEEIFKPFERLHSKTEYQGTGIGLATCQKVIQRHGGRIWAESEPGRGSVFHFTVPMSADRTCDGD
jgi:PAS domain S-box-containing protein